MFETYSGVKDFIFIKPTAIIQPPIKIKFQNSDTVYCWLARIWIPRIMDDPYSFDEDKVKDEGSFQVSISVS